jgi:archaemetzincin
MNVIQLLPVGAIDHYLLKYLQEVIPTSLRVECEILPFNLDPTPSYHAERQQFHSSEILQRMEALVRARDWRFLAICDVDLYIPILKYVFGEAQVGGPCALVSLFRLRQEFYGLNSDNTLLSQRLLKESIHELGHTLDLHHCQDYRCVMASSHAVEWIDLRESTLCADCQSLVESSGVLGQPRGYRVDHKSALP